MRFGSARVRMTPARSIARNVAVTPLRLPAIELVLSGWPDAENEFCVLKFTTLVP